LHGDLTRRETKTETFQEYFKTETRCFIMSPDETETFLNTLQITGN